jgi:hypothetical protein
LYRPDLSGNEKTPDLCQGITSRQNITTTSSRASPAILNRHVLAPSIEKRFVVVVFVCSVGNNFAGLYAKILVVFGKLDKDPLVWTPFPDLIKAHE